MWSIEIYSPPKFYPPSNWRLYRDELQSRQTHGALHLHQAMLEEIQRAFYVILLDWHEISSHVQNLLGDENAILDPRKHDELLFDNENFDGSRRYFWIINAGDEFLRTIKTTMETYNTFINDRTSDTSDWGNHGELMHQSEGLPKALASLIEEFTTQRDRAVGLRDGVCSHSLHILKVLIGN